jgi:riboflavin biosynthesis pyrimidine reductase
MRLLLDETGAVPPGAQVGPDGLRAVYAAPAPHWVRANFVSTLDGSVTGADGRSGSINTPADHVVFKVLRRLSDVVLVGAGTVRAEGYTPLGEEDGGAPALAVVTASGRVPPTVAGPPADGRGEVLLVTCAAAGEDRLREARSALGADAVLVCGDGEVDLRRARDQLAARGLRQVLCEGGPSLLGAALAAGVVDELDLTLVPTLVGGSDRPRITAGPDLGVALAPMALLEQDGTVLGRWRVLR